MWWGLFRRWRRSKRDKLGLDLIARHYLVVILKLELGDRTEQYDHDEYQQVQHVLTGLAEKNPDVFVLKRDWGDMILIMKGSTPEYLEEERDLLLDEIDQAVAKTRYRLTVGVGAAKERIADICQSFVAALVHLQNPMNAGNARLNQFVEQRELLKLDKKVVENYLRCGSKDEFDNFFDAYLRPLSETALRST